MCQNLALTVLYVPESGLECLIFALIARQREEGGNSPASLGLPDFSRIDMACVLSKFINFGAAKGPVSPIW